MSYQALARKYRPQRFNDIIGQETVVRTLQNAIEHDRIHHAYLFSGVRGVGKTTVARILAKALNCLRGPAAEPCNECSICSEITEGIDLDVREIDAATYTGVDNVRELRDITQFQPARDRYRIFIIDEAHMLSNASWNALLKLIEEPPPHVIFMFATTEMHRVPPTILSRVQKFALRKITVDELTERLVSISSTEKIEASREALEMIARRGEGSARDALSLLDQIIAFSGRSFGAAEVSTVLGLADPSFFARVMIAIADGDHARLLTSLQEAAAGGRDFKLLYRDLLSFIRNLLLLAAGADPALTGASAEELEGMRTASDRFSYSELLRVANLLLKDDETVNAAEHQRLAVEIALLKAATLPRLRSVEQVLAEGTPTAKREPATAVAEPRPTRSSQRPPAPAAAVAGAPSAPAPAGNLAALLTRLQKSKPLIASYLEHAVGTREDREAIEWTFDEPFYADAVSESKPVIESVAAEVFGRPVRISVNNAKAARAAADQPKASTSEDDPVLKAFAKHLGGEVVEPRKR